MFEFEQSERAIPNRLSHPALDPATQNEYGPYSNLFFQHDELGRTLHPNTVLPDLLPNMFILRGAPRLYAADALHSGSSECHRQHRG